MADDRQERIRQRAHEIWEREGRPHGSHERHWHQAAGEIEAEESKGKQPARTAGAKPAKTVAPGKASKPKAAAKPAARAVATAKGSTTAKTAKPAAKVAESKSAAKKAAKPKTPAKAG
ncbi:DUF2934 domain-containing protein [Mesorhizobium sp. NPDC059054]|uniref:DUF2934 domain-containing protein n=1 Tax=Mesorhizobium sp. NPDC059054 TaxID=3346711 RepID=UPI003691D4B2